MSGRFFFQFIGIVSIAGSAHVFCHSHLVSLTSIIILAFGSIIHKSDAAEAMVKHYNHLTIVILGWATLTAHRLYQQMMLSKRRRYPAKAATNFAGQLEVKSFVKHSNLT